MVTDHGKPLWKISPATRPNDETRDQEIDTELDSLLTEHQCKVSLSDIVTQLHADIFITCDERQAKAAKAGGLKTELVKAA